MTLSASRFAASRFARARFSAASMITTKQLTASNAEPHNAAVGWAIYQPHHITAEMITRLAMLGRLLVETTQQSRLASMSRATMSSVNMLATLYK